MVESADRRPSAEVFERPITLQMARGERITGEYPGTEVGVMMGEQVVWSREVYPIFVGLRKGPLLEVPRPRYTKRIASAERKAQEEAAKWNMGR